MKIRKLFIGISVLFVLTGILSFRFIYNTNLEQLDIVDLNHVEKTLEEEFEVKGEKISREGVIGEIAYRIVLKEDSNYTSNINNFIVSQHTVIDLENKNQVIGKIIITNGIFTQNKMKRSLSIIIGLVLCSIWLITFVAMLVIYIQIIKPFHNMQKFAQRVAGGDLDFRLDMQKNNYFGAFTESFDLMREELKKARKGEYEANISKKELVAELSHDIKTPVSTVKAICELIQVKFASAGEEDMTEILDFSKDKIQVVYNKVDTIDKLISNMFHATLEELEMLKIELQDHNSIVIEQMFEEINHYNKIYILNKIPQCIIRCDSLRLSQVIDNIISNSYKYANTDIEVSFAMDRENKRLIVKIKDFGEGVEEEQLPLICHKYYRATNVSATNTAGSGLGMYLAKIFMEGMQGTLEYYNDNGFVVEIGIQMS